jgi:hypothetical protein
VDVFGGGGLYLADGTPGKNKIYIIQICMSFTCLYINFHTVSPRPVQLLIEWLSNHHHSLYLEVLVIVVSDGHESDFG